jgi:hypothetical protein
MVSHKQIFGGSVVFIEFSLHLDYLLSLTYLRKLIFVL